MAEEWAARKRLAPGVTTPEIDRIVAMRAAARRGAAKVCGAGGGGMVAVWARPSAARRRACERALRAAGFRPIAVPGRPARACEVERPACNPV